MMPSLTVFSIFKPNITIEIVLSRKLNTMKFYYCENLQLLPWCTMSSTTLPKTEP